MRDETARTATLADGMLRVDGETIFAGVPETAELVPDPSGLGAFLRCAAAEPASELLLPLGTLPGMRRFCAAARNNLFWMIPHAGDAASAVPPETQGLLVELDGGRIALLMPLVDGHFRASLQGGDDGRLYLRAETGDSTTTGQALTGLFVAVGDDPYRLVAGAATAIVARLQRGRLRRDKEAPPAIDLFGWCTWNAFYHAVSHENVRAGLQSFAAGGVAPAFLIIDDGWLSVTDVPLFLSRLTSFAPNARFGGDLRPTVAMAKGEFGVRQFYVWHALLGYWGGVDDAAFPRYHIRPVMQTASATMRAVAPGLSGGSPAGVVQPEAIHRFFNDFHRFLRSQGIDGVKVDSQASLECVGESVGGRVELLRVYHEALEGAVQTHFRGSVINCMSCSNDMIFSTLNSTLTRTSDDFWPDRPASHGMHLYANAVVSLFFGDYIHPDWDMFESAHATGAFHAAGRAISGGPVYVSDKPGEHDFAVLRKLVLSDGTIPRAREIGRPTRDCLFRDVAREDALLKIFNRNAGSGIVGAFNARYHAEAAERAPVQGQVCPADVEGLEGDDFAVYAHAAGTLARCRREETLDVTLEELAFELFTIVPVDRGVAPVGLADKYNSGGAVVRQGWNLPGDYEVELRDGGAFLAWCAREPREVRVDGASHPFVYAAATGALAVEIAAPGAHAVVLAFDRDDL